MESNIIKAIRELSSRTDTNIANTRRELVSQMAKVHRELNSEVAQHHREIDSKVARTQRELDSKIAQHHRKLESEMASNHRELKSEMASNHRGLKYEVDKLDTIDWIVYLTFILSLVCIKYLQAASNPMLISTSAQFLEWAPWCALTELTLLCSELPLGSCSGQSTGPRLKRQKPFSRLNKLEKSNRIKIDCLYTYSLFWFLACLISTSPLLFLPLLYCTLTRRAKQML